MSVLTRIFLSLLRSSSSCPESNKEESYNTFFSLLICYNLQGRQREDLIGYYLLYLELNIQEKVSCRCSSLLGRGWERAKSSWL